MLFSLQLTHEHVLNTDQTSRGHVSDYDKHVTFSKGCLFDVQK